jgi:DNA repair photolyase
MAKQRRTTEVDWVLPLDRLPRPRPTTREVADLVRVHGLEGLPDATRRADEARYQEVNCRSALNEVKGMPFRWTLNPYRGCTHACEYCFARKYQTHLSLDSGDTFSSVILVKANVADVLRSEVFAASWQREQVALGTATDPYQPIEGKYALSRRCLEALLASGTPVAIVTKGPLIVRDRDLLAALSQRGLCRVYFSVPTVDETAWAQLEPGTAHPLQRLRALRVLRDAGVDAGVLVAPVVPRFTSHPAKMAATVAAVAEHGAAFVGMQIMNLEGGCREHFFRFLRKAAPDLLGDFERLYAGKYVPASYESQVRAVMTMLERRHGLVPRTDEDQNRASSHQPVAIRKTAAQPRFDWDAPASGSPSSRCSSKSNGRSTIQSSGVTNPSGI